MLTHRLGSALAALVLLLPLGASAAGFVDVLDTPAAETPLAAKTLLNGMAQAGQRLVAVGQRGLIIYSDDRGQNWTQAKVPLSADLVAVSFPTLQLGWAVGHDGVVLHSADAGASWVRQLDGRELGRQLLAYYTAEAAKGTLGTAEESAALVEEARRAAAQGADNPLLDVWFADALHGYVVGAFNLILSTEDGGKHWQPVGHLTDNPNRLHFYAVRGIGDALYLAGEQGLVLRRDAGTTRFRALETPYKGSYFGITGSRNAVLVYGLRGNAYRSGDGGASWQKVETGVQDALTAASRFGNQGLVLVSQSGNVLLSRDAGASFAPQRVEQATPAAAVLAVGQHTLVIAGARGVRTLNVR